MVTQTLNLDYSGQNVLADGLKLDWDSMTNVELAPSLAPTVTVGTGAPTFTANKGSLYLNLTGSSTATRLYVNNGTTTWIAVTTAS